jgi:hypothetical protein
MEAAAQQRVGLGKPPSHVRLLHYHLSRAGGLASFQAARRIFSVIQELDPDAEESDPAAHRWLKMTDDQFLDAFRNGQFSMAELYEDLTRARSDWNNAAGKIGGKMGHARSGVIRMESSVVVTFSHFDYHRGLVGTSTVSGWRTKGKAFRFNMPTDLQSFFKVGSVGFMLGDDTTM